MSQLICLTGYRDVVDEDDTPEPIAEDDKAKPENIPDWLQEIADEEAPEPAAQTEEAQAEPTDIPDWLQDVADEGEALEPVAEVDEAAADPGDIPDWLQEMTEEDAPKPVAQIEEDETADLLFRSGSGRHCCPCSRYRLG